MRTWITLVIVSLAMCSGCSHMNHTERGAVTGGVGGAAAGALIGAATGRPGVGAAVGGVLGTGVGAAVGNGIDRAERRGEAAAYHRIRHEQEIARARASALSVQDVVELSQQHISDPLIINQIRTKNAVFHLTKTDLIYLRQMGVSERVIAEMQRTATLQPRAVVEERVIIHEPAPPPVGVRLYVGPRRGCGPYWRRRRGCW